MRGRSSQSPWILWLHPDQSYMKPSKKTKPWHKNSSPLLPVGWTKCTGYTDVPNNTSHVSPETLPKLTNRPIHLPPFPSSSRLKTQLCDSVCAVGQKKVSSVSAADDYGRHRCKFVSLEGKSSREPKACYSRGAPVVWYCSSRCVHGRKREREPREERGEDRRARQRNKWHRSEPNIKLCDAFCTFISLNTKSLQPNFPSRWWKRCQMHIPPLSCRFVFTFVCVNATNLREKLSNFKCDTSTMEATGRECVEPKPRCNVITLETRVSF